MKRFLLTVLVLALSVSGLFAADYYIRDYEVSVEVGNDGVHHIEEYLAVVFDGNHHGIVREIPLDYRDYNGKTLARVKNISCSEKYTTSYDNGYLVMKIGDANKTVNGMVEYTITYDYDLGADFNEGYDEIYLNIIGTDWECPIYYAYFAIYLPYVPHEEWSGPEDYFNYVLNNAHLTSGSYGSDDFDWINGRGYLYYDDEDEGSLLIEGYMSGLGPYEGIAIRLDLPEGWYQGAREPWDHTDAMKIINPVVCILLLILALTLWILYGRDNVPIIVARFEPPKGFSPLMVGYVADSTVDDKDIISMLFYWADEGLLSMEEKSGKKYEFTKLKDIEAYAIESGKDIPQFEAKLFNGFFKGCDVGDSVKFKDLEKNSFFQTIVDTKMATKKFFKGKRALQDGKSRRMAILVSLLSLICLLPVPSAAAR